MLISNFTTTSVLDTKIKEFDHKIPDFQTNLYPEKNMIRIISLPPTASDNMFKINQ